MEKRKAFSKLGPGEGYEKGFTRTYILKLLINKPKGMDEPDIREIVRNELKIRQKKSVRGPLETLEEEELVFVRPKKGKPNVWKIKEDLRTLKKLSEFFTTYSFEKFDEWGIRGYATEFIASEYTQLMISESLRKHLKSLKVFTESQWQEILTIVKISPTALYFLLHWPGILNKNTSECDPKKVVAGLKVCLAYDGSIGNLVSKDFNFVDLDFKITLRYPYREKEPVVLKEAKTGYSIFERKGTIKEKKFSLTEGR